MTELYFVIIVHPFPHVFHATRPLSLKRLHPQEDPHNTVVKWLKNNDVVHKKTIDRSPLLSLPGEPMKVLETASRQWEARWLLLSDE